MHYWYCRKSLPKDYMGSTYVNCSFKWNAYPKFAILSAPKFFKKSGKDTDLTTQKLHYCGRTNHDHTRSHVQNGTVLKDTFLAPTIIRANKARTLLPLRQPLGPWIGIRHRNQRKWTHYMSGDNNIL
jgi:hypothetical protein